MVDKVHPLKIESTSTGGGQNDLLPTEMNSTSDYVATKGIAFENSDAQTLDVESGALTSSLNFNAPVVFAQSVYGSTGPGGAIIIAGTQAGSSPGNIYFGDDLVSFYTQSSHLIETFNIQLDEPSPNTMAYINSHNRFSSAGMTNGLLFTNGVLGLGATVKIDTLTGLLGASSGFIYTVGFTGTLFFTNSVLGDAASATGTSVNSIIGTTKQISVANGTSTILGLTNVVLSLPQNIDTGASVTFANAALNSGNLTSTAATFNLINSNVGVINFGGAATLIQTLTGITGGNSFFKMGQGTGAMFLDVNGGLNENKQLRFLMNSLRRWVVTSNNISESGSNAGSNMQFGAYDDSGTFIDNPLEFRRVINGTIFLNRPAQFATTVIIYGLTGIIGATGNNSLYNIGLTAPLFFTNGVIASTGTISGATNPLFYTNNIVAAYASFTLGTFIGQTAFAATTGFLSIGTVFGQTCLSVGRGADANTDGATLIAISSDRGWSFQQESTSGSAALRLRNTGGGNKNFYIDTSGAFSLRDLSGVSYTILALNTLQSTVQETRQHWATTSVNGDNAIMAQYIQHIWVGASVSGGQFNSIYVAPNFASTVNGITGSVRIFQARMDTPGTAGITLNNEYAYLAELRRANSGQVQNMYGFYASQQSATGGTIGVAYGLRIDNLTLGITNWAIASDGANSYHVGSIRFGSTGAPSTTIDVLGTGNFASLVTFKSGIDMNDSDNVIENIYSNQANQRAGIAFEHQASGNQVGAVYQLVGVSLFPNSTTNPQFVRNNAAVAPNITRLNAQGFYYYGDATAAGGTYTPTERLSIQRDGTGAITGDLTITKTANNSILTTNLTATATSNDQYAARINITPNPASGTANFYGLYCEPTVTTSAVDLSAVVGCDFRVNTPGLSITISDTYGVVGSLQKTNAGTATRMVGLYALQRGSTTTATVGTAFGLKIDNITVGQTNWAIGSLGANSFHVGNMRFGATTVPAATVDITGNLTVSSTATINAPVIITTASTPLISASNASTSGNQGIRVQTLGAANTGSPYYEWRRSGDSLTWLAFRTASAADNTHDNLNFGFMSIGSTPALSIGYSGTLGVLTSTVPHAGIGSARFAMDAPDGSTLGPHLQMTTQLDDYPLMQILPWTHDNVNIFFDNYWDGANFRSGHTTAAFRIRKVNGNFQIDAATPATTQGATLDTSFVNAIRMDGVGQLQLTRGIDMSYNTIMHEDWISAGSAGTYNWSNSSSTSGTANLDSSRVDQDHWGVVKLTVQSRTDPDIGCLNIGSNVIRFGDAAVFFETNVNVDTLSTSAQEFAFFIGFGDVTSTASGQVDAVGFLYERSTSTNWLMLTSSNSTQTKTDLGTAVGFSTWIKLGFAMNTSANSIIPYVNGVAGTAVTANIPTAVNRLLGLNIIAEKINGTSTSRSVFVDYFKYGALFGTRK